ncbi:triose-phosphate isomerase [Azovibrio restrictus]|uniref:triose-phosphate isomerase n=1 Tax=Azovibrio restrictus TaxID=146938 RepID=UPI0004158378|nr:triose-phosphate isomerase [Azovibrio restrictus]
MRRQPFVAGNWKMNGSCVTNQKLVAELLESLGDSSAAAFAVCVPHPYLDQVSRLLAGSCLALGAQDVSPHESGAYTGEVAASMLLDFACRYVIVGHSERRSMHAESDALVARKFGAARAAGLVPLLCLGETLAERQAGDTLPVLFRQLQAVLDAHGVAALADAVLAYEPVWAIGTGLTAAPEQAQAVHQALRQYVAERDPGVAAGLRIVYGGSVKAGNAAQLFAQPDIDGGLIGGASLDAKEFLAICQAANI